jgi:hypothetical protein
MRQPRRGTKSARTGANDDRICPNNRHSVSPGERRTVDPGWYLQLFQVLYYNPTGRSNNFLRYVKDGPRAGTF